MFVDSPSAPARRAYWQDAHWRSRYLVAVGKSRSYTTAVRRFAVGIVMVEIGIGADVIRDTVHVHVGFGANFGVSCLSS